MRWRLIDGRREDKSRKEKRKGEKKIKEIRVESRWDEKRRKKKCRGGSQEVFSWRNGKIFARKKGNVEVVESNFPWTEFNRIFNWKEMFVLNSISGCDYLITLLFFEVDGNEI